MRPILLSIALVSLARVEAREVIPGVVFFDEPPGWNSTGYDYHDSDNPFALSRVVRRYFKVHSPTPRDGVVVLGGPPNFNIGIGVVGGEIGKGKVVKYRALGLQELKSEVTKLLTGIEGAIIDQEIQETVMNGRTAFYCTYHFPLRGTSGAQNETPMWCEAYYIPLDENNGVTLSFRVEQKQQLEELRSFLKRITIPSDAHIALHRKPPREQILDNLRIITALGEHAMQALGTEKITLPEIRNFMAAELAKPNTTNAEALREIVKLLARLAPIDGENYEDLVLERKKPLRIKTKTLGELSVQE